MAIPQDLEPYILKLTEAAAIECYDWIGKGQEKAADEAAVTAMRKQFNITPIDGRIVIGEGERDEAPMLFIGEQLGSGGPMLDIAVDPLEGTTICAHAKPNSIAVLAIAPRGTILHAPDVYMEKIAVGAGLPKDIVDLDNSVEQNLKNLAKVKKCSLSELKVCILNRPRHEEIIKKVREVGASIELIEDGDVSAVIAVSHHNKKIDIYIGVGGAPEGVIAAAALSVLGGQMQGRLLFENEQQEQRAKTLGVKDLTFKYSINDMVNDDVIFCATGVTDGWLLKGIKRFGHEEWYSNSLIMHRAAETVRYVETWDRAIKKKL